MAARCAIELWWRGRWRAAGEVTIEDEANGTRSASRFEYDLDWLGAMADARGPRDARAVSCRYAVGYEPFVESTWPAFLLDMIPSGAARRHWEGRLELPNNERSDWEVLVRGAANPIGNLRVREAAEPRTAPHPGFARSEVLERAEGFVEYARANGAPVSGSTGAGGDSPKFLRREDIDGRWHADGALSDVRTRRCWLVKFPRTREASDRLILRAEAGYLAVAKELGARVGDEAVWEDDCLFSPRFDRVVTRGKVVRLGVESLCSLAGVAEFGAAIRKERLAAALARYATDPERELRELLLRDVLDVAMGNTDNHARNSSVLKTNGRIALSPLYDFAPMILDRRMVARVCRWEGDGDFPDWSRVAESLGEHVDVVSTKQWLRDLAPRIEALPKTMKRHRVPASVIARCAERIKRVADGLRAVGSAT